MASSPTFSIIFLLFALLFIPLTPLVSANGQISSTSPSFNAERSVADSNVAVKVRPHHHRPSNTTSNSNTTSTSNTTSVTTASSTATILKPWNPLREGSTIAVLPTEGPLAGERVEAAGAQVRRGRNIRCPAHTTSISITSTSTASSTTPTSSATEFKPWNPLREGSTLSVAPTGLPDLAVADSKEIPRDHKGENADLDEEKRSDAQVLKRRHYGRNERRMHGGRRVGPNRVEE